MPAKFEKVVYSGRSSFVSKRYDLPRFASPYHFHPECELTLIVESRGMRFVGDNIAPFSEGDLVFLGPNLPHYWCSDRMTYPRNRAVSIVVRFREDFLGKDFLQRPEMREIRSLIQRAARGLRFFGKTNRSVAVRMENFTKLHGSTRLIELLSILNELAHSKENEFLSSPRFRPSVSQVSADRVNDVVQWVNQNYQHPIRQVEVARKKAHMTPPAFSRFFKKKTGKTFSEFVNEVRIGEACWLLMEREQSVTEIGFACGFNNLSNFNRRFRELKEMSPREYRKHFHANHGFTFSRSSECQEGEGPS